MNNTENEILIEIKKGNKKALNTFIESNMNYVKYIASKYTNRGVDFEDLVQEGLLGLYKAIVKFDINKDIKFKTYAFYWIRAYIFSTIQKNGKNIYIPKEQDDKIYNIKQSFNILSTKLGRYPNFEELLKETKIPKKEFILLYNYLNNTISLQTPQTYFEEIGVINDEDELEDCILSTEENIEEKLELIEKKENILKFLYNCELSDQTIQIIKLRYGFYYNKIYTYQEISEILSISPQAIYMCEKRALNKIRKNKNLIKLYMYLDKPNQTINNFKSHYKKKK